MCEEVGKPWSRSSVGFSGEPADVGVAVEEPLRAGAVSSREILVFLVVVGSREDDDLFHPQHLTGDLRFGAGDREGREGEFDGGAVAALGTPGRHQPGSDPGVERDVVPAALHPVKSQHIRALDILAGGIRRRTDEFLEQRAHHPALGDQTCRYDRCGVRRVPSRLGHVPDPDPLRDLSILGTQLIHARCR